MSQTVEIKWYFGLAIKGAPMQAQPITQAYELACMRAEAHANRIDGDRVGGFMRWNDHYLAALWRQGLMLTTHHAYELLDDPRYPGGKPKRAPRPTDDEPDCWPPETWIVFRE